MSRGRPIAGPGELTERVSAALDGIVAVPRDRGKLAQDVADMRARIEREKPAANAFDVKLARGGLVDCEFAAQFLVLAGLGRIAGEATQQTLRRAVREGQVPGAEGEQLATAAALQSALMQVQRIAAEGPFDPASASEALQVLLAGSASAALAEGLDAAREGESLSFDALADRLSAIQDDARKALEAVLRRPIA